ncbi:MAG: M20/M25/M40 family metallo-hydrolase [Candidatus Aminicenantaceae bacterium]
MKEKVTALINAWEEEQLDFLTSLCEQNSYTFNKRGSDRVSALILDRLENVFPIHKVVEQERVGNHHILKTQNSGKAVYLIGHTDTVFPPDHPFQTCRREGEWLIGPGTADMKGGLAVVVYALKALMQTGALESMNVAVILGGDEENGSATSQTIYEEERENARICLVSECAGENGEIVTSRNGKTGGCLECFGLDRHVGSVTEEKTSAILEIAHKVIAFESLNDKFPGVRVNVGWIEGGLGPGTIPGRASFLFDLRWEKEEHHSMLLERIREIVSQCQNPQSSCHLNLLNFRPSMPLNEKTEKLIACLRTVAETLGQEFSTEHRRGTSDGNYFGAGGVPTLDGFGPVGIRDHTPDERILISSLKGRTALLAFFLIELQSSNFFS